MRTRQPTSASGWLAQQSNTCADDSPPMAAAAAAVLAESLGDDRVAVSPESPRGISAGRLATEVPPRCREPSRASPRFSRSVASPSSTASWPKDVWPESNITQSFTCSRNVPPQSISREMTFSGKWCASASTCNNNIPDRAMLSTTWCKTRTGIPPAAATVSRASSHTREITTALADIVTTNMCGMPCKRTASTAGSKRTKKPDSDDSRSNRMVLRVMNGRRQFVSLISIMWRNEGNTCICWHKALPSSEQSMPSVI
mmetsp:Transcript_18110/g.50259  ORF Transcript_18110/g.50259 Transcript_18110/m.50259 type:complete len:257 (-) Transcript_18110:1443-2213(-)